MPEDKSGFLRNAATEVGLTCAVLVKHTIYIVVAIGCMWVIEAWMHHLPWWGGDEPSVFGVFALKDAFLVADLSIVAAFYYYALGEIRHIHHRSQTHDTTDAQY
jgi:hypothetical protein